MSATDILTYLYFEKMNVTKDNVNSINRDRFVLSKGHASPALYAVLAEKGFIDKEQLKTFRNIASKLQGHPNMNYVAGIDMSTGSLGQGISCAVGMAVSNKVDEKSPPVDVEEMIIRALAVKKDIVDKDEKENGLRKLLNFGHTIGHAIESIYMPKYYHGECVGVGMLMIMENEELREKVKNILVKMGMPTHIDFDIDEAMNLIKKDKKYNGSKVSVVQVDEVGKGYLKDVDLEWIRKRMEDYNL